MSGPGDHGPVLEWTISRISEDTEEDTSETVTGDTGDELHAPPVDLISGTGQGAPDRLQSRPDQQQRGVPLLHTTTTRGKGSQQGLKENIKHQTKLVKCDHFE